LRVTASALPFTGAHVIRTKTALEIEIHVRPCLRQFMINI
jgi:hypothetical protein